MHHLGPCLVRPSPLRYTHSSQFSVSAHDTKNVSTTDEGVRSTYPLSEDDVMVGPAKLEATIRERGEVVVAIKGCPPHMSTMLSYQCIVQLAEIVALLHCPAEQHHLAYTNDFLQLSNSGCRGMYTPSALHLPHSNCSSLVSFLTVQEEVLGFAVERLLEEASSGAESESDQQKV